MCLETSSKLFTYIIIYDLPKHPVGQKTWWWWWGGGWPWWGQSLLLPCFISLYSGRLVALLIDNKNRHNGNKEQLRLPYQANLPLLHCWFPLTFIFQLINHSHYFTVLFTVFTFHFNCGDTAGRWKLPLHSHWVFMFDFPYSFICFYPHRELLPSWTAFIVTTHKAQILQNAIRLVLQAGDVWQVKALSQKTSGPMSPFLNELYEAKSHETGNQLNVGSLTC